MPLRISLAFRLMAGPRVELERPIPFIVPDESDASLLVVSAEAVRVLSAIRTPVAVVAVCGVFCARARGGKAGTARARAFC